MLKVVRSVLGASFAVLYGCSTVWAAAISAPAGAVLINEGTGFVPLKGSRARLRPSPIPTHAQSRSILVAFGRSRRPHLAPKERVRSISRVG